MNRTYLLAVYWRALSLFEFGVETIFSVANSLKSGIETLPGIVRAELFAESTEYVNPRSATPICAPFGKSVTEVKDSLESYQVQEYPEENC